MISYLQANCNDVLMNTSVVPPPSTSLESNFTNWTIYELSNSTGARCLDGSNYKFSYMSGSGSGTKRFMIFFPGGGFCGYENLPFLDSCQIRSKGGSGSSTLLGSNGTTRQSNSYFSYFSSLQEINPLFYNWNKVLLLSCDGTMFQGYLEEPILYNNSYLYFRGYNNTKGTMEFLKQNMALFEAEEVIIVGNSSGAHAVLMWIEYLRKYLPRSIKMAGVSDAGMFLDVKNFNSKCHVFRRLINNLANYTKSRHLDIFDSCSSRNSKKNFYKCMIPQYFISNITVDMFFINSQVDFEVLRGAYGLHCLDGGLNNCSNDTDAKILKFREKILRFALNLKKNKPNFGFWLRRCLEHFYIHSDSAWRGNYTVFSAENFKWKNIREAFYDWYTQKNYFHDYIDLGSWEDDCPVYSN